ncbi:MAG: N-acetylmuramoyl-L-alanine amidase, partial [Oscillospiraceae bacterium]
CSARSTPLYVMHASSKAITDEAGWGEYDQLSRQVIEARELAGFSGSIFDSLSRMVENPKEFATKLIGYYNGSVKPEHIMTDLELTQPAKTTFTSFEKTVVFAGNTDPNTDATINGVPIKVDENGYFALEMELTEGENTFQIVHKGRTASYQITRVIEVVREVTPQSGTSIEADGGTKLTISAVAYREAKVYAVINGKTVSLKIPEDEGDGDHDLRGTAYARFTGVYTVPDATTSVQNLGPITVWGEWGEIKKSKQGAVIKVNARALPSDGTPIVVTAAWAETFPSSTLSQYSHPNYLPLPKGALDYAIGNEIKYTFVNDRNVLTTYKVYKLQSGLRVFSDDISAVSVNSAPVNNVITGCTVASDDRYTKVILATRQQVSYVAKYSESSDRLTVQFNYTNSLPESMTLNKNPLFSAVTFSGDTMTLKFREKGVFLGYDAYFDDSGNLVMRFNNPPQVSGNDLSGVRIAIDPGHVGNDSGALGYLGAYPERVVNWSISSKLASVLKSRGAEVIMWDTRYNNYSLPQRVQMAVDAEPHLLLSVHSNSAGSNRAATGSEAYYFTPWSYALSQYAAGNLAGALGTENRGGKFGYYYLTRNTQFSSALVETGFMTNQNEYSKLVDDSYQNRMATGLANAITQYFQLMGKNAGLTGTQSSGSAVTDSGQGTGNAAARPPQTDVTLELSESALELAVDDEVTLEAWVGGLDNAEIVWSAEGNREVAELIEEGDTMTLVALMPGTMVITAQIKGQSACVASCKLTVTA